MGRCLRLPVEMTAETLLDMGRCLHLPAEMTAETSLDTGRCLHLPAEMTAETCGSFSSGLDKPPYSGFTVGIPEVGVWV